MVLLFFVAMAHAQQVVEKSIRSEAEKIVIECGIIDQIELFHSDSSNEIDVRAEGAGQKPVFDLVEKNGLVLLRDIEIVSEEAVFELDKVCSIEPDYTSYQILVPQNKELFVSFTDGNIYADNYHGSLEIKGESGIVKLKHVSGSAKVKLNSGSVFVDDISNARVNVQTNLGLLSGSLLDSVQDKGKKNLDQTYGNPVNSIWIRTILANIFLYGPKD